MNDQTSKPATAENHTTNRKPEDGFLVVVAPGTSAGLELRNHILRSSEKHQVAALTIAGQPKSKDR